MKTIQAIAAQYNLYLQSDLPKEYKEYWDNRMNEYNKGLKVAIPQFIVDNPNFDVGLFFECRIQDEGTEKEYKYIEHNYILVKREGSDLICMLKSNNKGKYYLYPYYSLLRKFISDISNHETKEVYEELLRKEPNLIGVFTEKKLNDWFDHCQLKVHLFKQKYEEINGKSEESKQIVLDFIEKLGDKCTVKQHKNWWAVETKHFYVDFTLDYQSGWLDQKIRFKGKLQSIIDIEG
jgi:hypothetical protein